MAKKSNPKYDHMIAHFPKEEAFIKRMVELMRQVDVRSAYALTPFLAPHHQLIVQDLVKDNYGLTKSGVYEDAEMQRLAIYDTSVIADIADIDFEICQIVAACHSKFVRIAHQDVLGALMALSLQRDQFGDIHINENQIGIIVPVRHVRYITANLTQIHQLPVAWKISDVLVEASLSFEIRTSIVSSLRIDCIVADICRISRAKAKEMIVSGLVKVNHSVIDNAEKLCHNKDIISIRGFGRFQIDEIQGMTKKGNIAVAIRQFK